MKRTKREISQKDIKRFWNSVEKAGEDDCWGWKLCSNTQGYALFTAGGKMHRAQRFAYTHGVEPIPTKQRVTSTCKDKQCCNLKHLYTASQYELLAEARERGTLSVGIMNKASKLQEADIVSIRAQYKRGHNDTNYVGLAKQFEVTVGCIRDIVLGKTWKHIA
tara:strand:- start:332 stop:820 length:489 start_codon:yes stop_codon:yes gene_type:complete